MIEVIYYYSACVGIRTQDVSILCDPWFTDGIYDGSWYHYPPVKDPMGMVGQYDYIYISHIHPDHYDVAFLRQYLARFPATKIFIAPFEKNFLSKKMNIDGIPHEIIDRRGFAGTSIALFPNESYAHDVDSALVVKRGGQTVVNLNDNMYNGRQLDSILGFCEGSPQIALMTYTGAGPYPQTYYDDKSVLMEKASAKKKEFIDRYFRMKEHLSPKRVIPFAGKYVLGGELGWMNRYRGISDAVDIARLDPQAVVLADGGKARIDTETLKPSAVRSEPYPEEEVESYVATLRDKPLLCDIYFAGLPVDTIPLRPLLKKAYEHAHNRSTCSEDYYFCINLGDEWFVANAKAGKLESRLERSVDQLTPRHEIRMNPRHLFGLLTGVFHWNNAEVGSLFRSRRVPDKFHRSAMGFLNFFHV